MPKRRMKRLIGLLGVAAIALLLASCGGDATPLDLTMTRFAGNVNENSPRVGRAVHRRAFPVLTQITLF